MGYGFVDDIVGGLKKFGMKLPTSQLEVTEGILKRDIVSLNSTKGMNRAFVSESRKLARQGNIDINNAVYKALRKGDASAVADLTKDSQEAQDLVLDAMSNVKERSQRLGAMADFDEAGNITSVNAADAAPYYDEMRKGSWGDKASYYTSAARAYFSEPGKRSARIGAAAGAYAAGAIGVRLLDGGSLTRNSSGERDIAGIPFF